MPEQITHFPALRLSAPGHQEQQEAVAIEEPLELSLRLRDRSIVLTVLMRTPGHDQELLQGWLVSEGFRLAQFQLFADPANPNVWYLETPEHERLTEVTRLGMSSSACGICGTGSIERLSVQAERPQWTLEPLKASVVRALPETLRGQQRGFEQTGGLHGAGLFTPGGTLLAVFEDVGRHNAVDKVVGSSLMQLPLTNTVLCVSSRAGFEIVQKAVMAGVSVVVSVGAPTSLAIETAQVFGITLCAFTREGRTTVYSGAERLRNC